MKTKLGCFVLAWMVTGPVAAQSGGDVLTRAAQTLHWQFVVGSGARDVIRLEAAPKSEAEWRKALASAKVAIVPGDVKDLAVADRVAAATGAIVAIDTATGEMAKPESALRAVQPYSRRIQLWADPVAWDKAGTRPLAAVYILRERLAGGTLQEGPIADEFLKEAYRLDIKPLVWLLPGPEVKRTAAAVDALLAYHASYASRTSGVRRFGEVTPEERAKVEAAIPAALPAKPKKARKLLVFDLNVGRFGHPSIPYANLSMQLAGKKTGAWEATVTSDPVWLEPSRLREFDAVYLNNTIGDIFSTSQVRDAFAEYVRNGGGVIGNHATTVTATDWKEFGEILGARGASHRMTDERVVINVEEPGHPVTKAFGGAPYVYADEYFRFQAPYRRDKVRVLLSIDPVKTDLNQGRCYGQCYRDDSDYPVAWIKTYGKGRVFYTTLGHNPHVFWDPKLVPFFLAGVQYALGDLDADAEPRPQMAADWNKILADLARWDRGQEQGPVRRLDRAIGLLGRSPQRIQDAEAQLAAFLQGGASAAAKEEVCRRLADLGSSRSVPALSALLQRPEFAHMARFALERIEGPEAVAALREALPAASEPKLRAELMYSLARRHDAASTAAISKWMTDTNPVLSASAINALGILGTPEAERLLLSVPLTRATADALLTIAEQAPADRAAAIYKRFTDASLPSEVRTAAVRRSADASPFLTDPAADVQAAAITSLVVRQPDRMIAGFPKLTPAGKIQTLALLAAQGSEKALPLFTDALRSDIPEVRLAALLGLAEVGTAAQVPLLVEAANRSPDAEREAARYALSRLPGSGVDAAIATSLGSARGTARLELIRAVGERGMTNAADALLAAARDSDTKTRRAAMRALRQTATPAHSPALLQLLLKTPEDDRPEAESALAAALRRAEKPDVSAVISAYQGASAEMQGSLLTVLAMSGANEGLPVLRSALQHNDPAVQRAAITGLSAWTAPDPKDDLLRVARTSSDAALKVLALRGYIRLVQLPAGRPPAETAALLGAALEAASRPDEKKAALAALQRVACPESLEIVRKAANDPAVAAEAKLAIATLERSLAARRSGI